MSSFTLALVGRPNVGKSTLFNRLIGKRLALVDYQPGVTRDWREGDARLGDLAFTVLDTAGFDEGGEDPLAPRLRARTMEAVARAHACLLIYDARAGLTPHDVAFAALLRGSGKPVLLAANKAEGRAGSSGIDEGWSLGFGEPLPLSAEHGEGMADLYAALEPLIAEHDAKSPTFAEGDEDEGAFDPDAEWTPDLTKPLRMAFVGRPNVGKSTLVNAMIGSDRLLTGPEAGLTRDAIGVEWVWASPEGDRPVKIFDTAGLRRRARIDQKLEKLAASDTVRAAKFAEVCGLVLDAERALEKQDLQIADLVLREGRALMILVNKWDLVEDRQAYLKEVRDEAERLLPQAKGLPVLPISAETGEGLQKIMPTAAKLHGDWNARVKTRDLNDWLRAAQGKHPPPAPSGRRVKIRYMAQTKARPPTFVAFVNRPDDLPESYVRYLVAGIRDTFDIPAVPIRIRLKKGDNPYAPTRG